LMVNLAFEVNLPMCPFVMTFMSFCDKKQSG
jgi:hypothetical protein